MIGLIGDALELNPTDSEINLQEVEADVLNDIIEFCKWHKYVDPPLIPKPLPDSDLSKI